MEPSGAPRPRSPRRKLGLVLIAPFFVVLSPLLGAAAAARRLWRSPQERALVVSAFAVLAFGTVAFHFVEDWDYLDSLYFSVISLLTIGYGDFVPTTDLGKVLTILYVIAGVSIILGFVDAIAKDRLERGYLARREERMGRGTEPGGS
jgi:voltage-gated potassium channel